MFYFLDVRGRELRRGLESGEESEEVIRGDIFEGCDFGQPTHRPWFHRQCKLTSAVDRTI